MIFRKPSGWIATLIAIGKSSHARHDTEHVVVCRVDTDSRACRCANSVVGDSEEECCVINTRQVACAAGLVLLGLESKGVDVDTNGRDVGVVLVRLHLVEIASLANLETVVTVELEKSRNRGVVAGEALNACDRVARLEDGAVPPVGVVEGLLALPGRDDIVVA